MTAQSIPALLAVAALPFLISWLVVLVPSRRRHVSGLLLGNPLDEAPVPVPQPPTLKPLVHLSRALLGNDMRGYIVGARHLPVENTAPVLRRFVKGQDPALQLYAQSILADGQDKLQHWFVKLEKSAAQDERCAAWLLEIGLALAHRNLGSAADREALLAQLYQRADRALKQWPQPRPHLLANAGKVFLEAGHPALAARCAIALPHTSLLRPALEAEALHALRHPSPGGTR
jgi:hypothetical protein